jgi:hypothetical protein
MTVRKTALGVTSRKRDFAISFSPQVQYIVRMMLLLGTVKITVNRNHLAYQPLGAEGDQAPPRAIATKESSEC